jgi:hypothetical protein
LAQKTKTSTELVDLNTTEIQGLLDTAQTQKLIDDAETKATRITLNEQKAETKTKANLERQAIEDAKPLAETDELGFYSKAEQALLDLKQDKNLPQDILKYLRKQGVTSNELEDTGLLAMLNAKKASGERVTREGLLDFIGENKVKLHEYQHVGASEDDFLDNMGDFELQEPTNFDANADDVNFKIQDNEHLDTQVEEFMEDSIGRVDMYSEDYNGIFEHLNKNNKNSYPHPDDLIDKQIQTITDEVKKIDTKYPMTDGGTMPVDVHNHRTSLFKKVGELEQSKTHGNVGSLSEEAVPDWWNKIQDAIDNDNFDSLPLVVREDIEQAVRGMKNAEYLDNPYYEWELRGGYTASGNEDIGITIKEPDGSYINTTTDYAGNTHPEPVYSVADANAEITAHSIDHGYQSYSYGETMYSSHTQPGMVDKSTYREIPIMGKLTDQPGFTGAHMNEDDVVAWLRTSDRLDSDGKRVLFVEEVQSDWHQQGRKRGYNKTTVAQATGIKRRIKEIESRDIPNAETMINVDSVKWNARLEKLKDEMAQLRGKLADIDYNVPNAPLKNEKWQEAAVDRAMKIASEEGYDRVVFANSKQQLDVWNPERRLNDKGKIRNEELYVNIYDNNIPSFVNKYAKKYGTTTGKTKIDFNTPSKELDVHREELTRQGRADSWLTELLYIDVTPKGFKENIKRTPLPAAFALPIGSGLIGDKQTQTDDGEGLLKIKKKVTKPMNSLFN